MDVETRELLRGSLRELYAADGDVVGGLAGLGWHDVLAEDPDAATELLFSEQGAAGRATSVLDTVFRVGHDGVDVAVVHPVNGPAAARVVDGVVVVDGVLLGAGPGLVAAGGPGGTFLIDAGACAETVSGFDPDSQLRRVRVSVAREEVTEAAAEWEQLTAAARKALASELVGSASAMLGIATEQITDRVQFGRPIGANQSPRHRLAEAYAQVRGAAELTSVAWRTGRPSDARIAKAYAGFAAETTSRGCLQVCGAIGLTAEHALPRYVKRSRVLDALYGGWVAAANDIGRHLLESGAVPVAARL